MTAAQPAMPAPLAADVRHLVQRAQAQARVPALAVAVHRADRPLWTCEVGGTGTDAPLDADTQFRMGSVTKTFTAVLALQCRDDGLLDLDDPVSAHLPVPAHGGVTVRRLLSHLSGLQREPHGDVWDTLRMPDVAGLLADLAAAERVLPGGRRFHYSNLGPALLGHLVGRLRGGTWEEVLADRILTPLRLSGTAVRPTSGAAVGYLVDAYSDHARPEPAADFLAVGPACQLWSTSGDLARWAGFLADPAAVDPAGKVLSPATLEEMRWPQAISDEAQWRMGMGLGLMVSPRASRVTHVGHYGAMPGYLAAGFGQCGGETPRALGVGVLGSSGTAGQVLDLVHQILDRVAADDPAPVAPWRPGPPAPEAYRSALGRWWSEGRGHDFRWRGGELQAVLADGAPDQQPSRFAPLDGQADALRTLNGAECGELLRLTRDSAGRVVRMHWATYRFTREQETFDGHPAAGP